MHVVSVAHNFACMLFQWLITILTACTVFQWLITILAWLHAWLMDILTVAIYHTCCDPDKALEHFQQEVPTLGLLGTPHYIDPDTPYTVDEEVQLVCKYLKALHIGGKKGIDKLYQEGEVQVLPVTTG